VNLPNLVRFSLVFSLSGCLSSPRCLPSDKRDGLPESSPQSKDEAVALEDP